MTVMTYRWPVLAALLCTSLLLSACSTAVSAVADVMGTHTLATESRLRAEQQSDAQAFEERQTPNYTESEASYLRVIEQMQQEGLWYASLAHIDALENQWPASEQSKLLRADALRQTGNKTRSAALYQQLLQGRYAARAQHGLGLIAAAEGRFDSAVAHMQSAQKKAPTDALLLNDLGYALLHTPQAINAALPLKQAAQLQPKNVRIQSNLALYLVMFASAKEAWDWMEQSSMSLEQRMRVLDHARRLGEAEQADASAISTLHMPVTAPPQNTSVVSAR